MSARSPPRVGVSIFVLRLGTEGYQFITGFRRGSHGAGTIQLPGGHLEHGESWTGCAAREVLEETGLTLPERSIRFLTATNDIFEQEQKHYVTIFMVCLLPANSGDPEVMEPQKCDRWEWTSWTQLSDETERDRLFLPLQTLLAREPNLELYPEAGTAA